MTKPMERTIQRIVAFAAQLAEPDEIILFGSMAHGKNRIHSDLDLLIVMSDDFQDKQISERVKQFAGELAVKADVLVYPRFELERAVQQRHSFLASVLHDGKTVYRKGGNSWRGPSKI